MYFLNKTWSQSYSLIVGYKIHGVMDPGKKTAFISLYISIRTLGWPDTLSMGSIILKCIFFLWADLNSGLKIFSKPYCRQIYCHPGFVVSLQSIGKNRFIIILKGLRIFRIANECWLQLKVTSCISFNIRVSLSFEALKPGIDFFLDIKFLNGIFFQ